MLILRALIVVLLSVMVSEADVYRYVDDSGVACYTDLPLNKKAEKIIKTDSAVVPKDSASGKTTNKATDNDLHSIVVDKANKYDLDPSLVHAVITTESNGDPSAVSRKGAMGLMQLMPSTANDLEVRNPFDPEENVEGGTKYLKSLIERFRGDLTLALAAYNAGPKLVEKRGCVPEISETKQYVKKVLSLYNGKKYQPVQSSAPTPTPAASVAQKPERIYKVIVDDGSVLFTNSPFYKKNPRF